MALTDAQWLELFKTLGVAGPLVLLLFYLLRENIAERKAMTQEFLKTLQETVKSAGEVAVKSAESMDTVSDTLRQTTERHSREHERIIDAIITAGRPPRQVLKPRDPDDT